MAEYEYGYLEGDQLGKPRDFGLLARLFPFLRPSLGLVGAASFLIVILIGLELAMPFVTRQAIDGNLTPYHLRLDPGRLHQSIRLELEAALPEPLPSGPGSVAWISQSRLRSLDPKLAARLRKSNALDRRDWYRVARDPESAGLAQRHPHWFDKAGEYFYIPVDRLERLKPHELKILRGHDALWLCIWAGLFALLAALSLVVSFFQTMALEKAGQNMVLDLRMKLYGHLLTRPLGFFHKNPVGKLVTRVNNDVQNIAEIFRGLLVGLFRDILLMVGAAAVMLALDWKLALLCMALAPVVAFLAWRLSFLAREVFRRLQGYMGRINTLMGETVSGAFQIRLLGAQWAFFKRLTRLNREHFRAGMDQVRLFAVFLPLVELLGSLAMALMIWYGGGWVIQDRISLGTLVAFFSYFQMFMSPIRELAEKYHLLQGALASAERIMVLMEKPRGQELHQRPTFAPSKGLALEFKGVEFGYQAGRPVIHDLELAIAHGQSVALVGPSGCGKSTLVNLALRLYSPWKGGIALDGRNLIDYTGKGLCRAAALVSQETVFFHDTLARNVSLGRPDVSPERLEEALRISGACDWAHGLPQGLETIIGRGGRQLSQGQRQMLALARALAGNPRVLILDEAFSQVDPASEQAIHQALPAVMKGRTTVLVAHRISTARNAERILVMREGRLIEDGSHRGLMKSGGLYADMVNLQDMDKAGRWFRQAG